MKALNVGLIGYGFMARAHANALRKVGNFFDLEYAPVLKAACGRTPEKIKAFADKWGFESVETDWKKLIARKDIDLIDICAPNNVHKEMSIAAAKAGKMILCEKPLAMNAAEGLEMVNAVEATKVPNMVSYNYRRVPAVTFARQLIDEGRLGRIFHYRTKFLQDWTISKDVHLGGASTWRLDAKAAGSGVTGDMLTHCIDTALWLNGGIDKVTAMTETFIKERKNVETVRMEKVGIDDSSVFLARFRNGSLATFEATRYARGHKAQFTLEINGEYASILWELHDLHRLQWFDHRDPGNLRGWSSIHVSGAEHPYMKNWWVPGLQIGYEHTFIHQIGDFLKGLEDRKPAAPTFRDGLATDLVTDAVLKSAKSGRWEAVRTPAP